MAYPIGYSVGGDLGSGIGVGAGAGSGLGLSGWLGLGGAGLGLAKSLFVDGPRAARQRKEAAAITRYSPWTGLQSQQVQDPNPFGDVLQGGSAGLALGQSLTPSVWEQLAKKKLMEGSY